MRGPLGNLKFKFALKVNLNIGGVFMLRTTPPEWYIPPERDEIKSAAEKVGIRNYSRDLAVDLSNVIAGGSYKTDTEVETEVRSSVLKQMKNQTNYSYIDDAVEKQVKYNSNVSSFIKQLETNGFESIPGNSPLEKAMAVIKLLSKSEGGQSGSSNSDDPELPIFSQSESRSESAANDISEAIESASEISDAEKELLQEDSSSDGKDSELSKLEIAEMAMTGLDKITEISRILDKSAKFQVRKTKKVFPDPQGRKTRNRPIKDLDEINKLLPVEWIYGTSSYNIHRFLTGEALVRERVTYEEKKQLLFVIVDCSGSMKHGERVSKAGGVIMNRLQAVNKGECELYFTFFDSRIYQTLHAFDKVSSKQCMDAVRKGNYSGGSTAIQNCIGYAITEINSILENRPELDRPELVVVTDGDDTVNKNELLKKLKDENVKLHAFLVAEKNQNLLDAAKASGGLGLTL